MVSSFQTISFNVEDRSSGGSEKVLKDSELKALLNEYSSESQIIGTITVSETRAL